MPMITQRLSTKCAPILPTFDPGSFPAQLLVKFLTQPCELILFDLDGTLVDSVPDIALALDRCFELCGYTPPGEPSARHWVGNGSRKLVERALAAELQIPGDSVDQTLVDSVQQHFFDAYDQCCDQRSQLYPGVAESLQQLESNGISMACVTNKPARFTHKVLAGMGIDHHFCSVVSGDTLATRKPDPGQLLHVVGELGKQAGRTLMVGDSKNDVEAARAAGVAVVCVNYGYNHGEPVESAGPDAIIGNLLELCAWV